jgi:hypothetical protein
MSTLTDTRTPAPSLLNDAHHATPLIDTSAGRGAASRAAAIASSSGPVVGTDPFTVGSHPLHQSTSGLTIG